MTLGLGGNSQLGIGIAVMLKDQFSANARKISASMKAMRAQGQSDAMQAMRDYQNRATSIAAGASAVTFGLMKMAKQGASFEQIIQKVAIVADGKLGRGKLKQLALDMSETFRMDPNKVATGLFENVKAGVTDNIDLITKYQVAVSKAVDETLEGETGVAKGLLNITNAMGLAYSEFPRVANAVTVAANQSQASVESLNEAMKYTANTASKAGYGLEPTLAALAQLSQMGIEGTAAGTALSNLIRYSTRAGGMFGTKKQIQGLAILGLGPKDLRDAQGNVISLIELIDKLSAGMKGLPTGAQLDAMEAILGVRGEKAGINLTGTDGRGMTTQKFLTEIQAGVQKDIAMSQAKKMMDTLAGDFELVKVKWMQFVIAFSNAVEPLLRRLLPVLSSFLNGLSWFVSTGVGGFIAKLAMIAAPMVAVLWGLRAAAMAATFALGSMSSSAGMGGFMGILRGGMGAVGMRGTAAAGIGSLALNSAGRAYVAAGQTFAYGGMIYKAGQMVPRAAMAAAGVGAAGMGAGAAIGIGSRVLGFLGGPWGMAIMAGMTILPLIYDVLSNSNKKSQATVESTANDFQGFGKYLTPVDKDRIRALQNLGLKDQASKELNQKIEIYLNGQPIETHDAQYKADQDILNQFNVSF